MKKILISREETQYRYYSKESRKRTRSASRVNQSKDVFTGKPIDVSNRYCKGY